MSRALFNDDVITWTGVSDGTSEVSLAYSSGATGTLDGPCNMLVNLGTASSSTVDLTTVSVTFGAP